MQVNQLNGRVTRQVRLERRLRAPSEPQVTVVEWDAENMDWLESGGDLYLVRDAHLVHAECRLITKMSI